MPDPRWVKVWRDAWLHRARTALVIVAIALGLAAAGGILNAWAIIDRATREDFLAANPAAATLRIDRVDERVLALVRTMPGVRDVQARRVEVGSVQVQGLWRSLVLYVVPAITTSRVGMVKPYAGVWPPRDGALSVEHSSVEFSGAAVGERVQVLLGNGAPVSVEVAGVVRDVTLAPGWMEHVVYAFATPGTMASLGLPSELNEVQFTVDAERPTRSDVQRVAWSVQRALEGAGRVVTNVDVPEPGEHIHAAQMDSLLYTQGAFGLLALLVCGFLVVNLMGAMLAGQVREIGIMKSLGAHPRQLMPLYLVFAAAIGASAALLALPAAFVIGRRYAEFRGEMLNFDVRQTSLPWWVVALQLVVGVALPLVAAWFPVRRGCAMPVAGALRDVGIDAADAGASSWMLRVPGLSRPVLLSIRNAFRRRLRMVLTLLALSSGGAVFLGAANLRAAVRGAVDLLFAAQRYDFSVRLADPHAPDSLERVVRGVSGVADAEAWGGASATLIGSDSLPGPAFSLTAVPADSRRYAPRLLLGRWMRAHDTLAVVVSRSLVKANPSLQLGATAALEVRGTVYQWTVVGVVDAGPVPVAFTTREALARATNRSTVGGVVVASDAGGVAAQVDLIQRVRAALEGAGMPVASSTLLEENRRVMEDHLLMVVEFLTAMGWIMLAVGGMGLGSTMGMAVMERTRELGVMRAIGASHGSIVRLVLFEGVVIALLGWLVALPLSIPVSLTLGEVFGRVMLPVPTIYVPEATAVARWLLWSVGVSALATAWPAWRATRVTVAQALLYE